MNAEEHERDEWQLTLSAFIGVRLRTPSFRAAVRRHRNVLVPLPLPNTQFLIDAIVWSVADHPDWWHEAWLSLFNHLKQCGQRLTAVAEKLKAAPTAAGTLGDKSVPRAGPLSSRVALAGATQPVLVERQVLYDTHVAVQDVYLAFCVLDAVMKSTCIDALRDMIERHLPSLVVAYMPAWDDAVSSAILRDAVEEYRMRFLDVARSWLAMGCLRADTIRRLDAHVDQTLRLSRETLGGDAATSQPKKRSRLESILSAVGAHQAAPSLNQPGGAGLSQVTAASPLSPVGSAFGGQPVGVVLARFVDAIFPAAQMTRPPVASFAPFGHGLHGGSRGGVVGSWRGGQAPPGDRQGARCPHCSAVFQTVEAKNTHYRSHFYYRNIVTGEALVRLRVPSVEDFVLHENDWERRGDFVPTIGTLEEAHRAGNALAVVRVRKSHGQS